MQRQTNRYNRVKPRSSVKYCEEHSACPQDKPNTAEFYCADCKSFQCRDCNKELHTSYSSHDCSRLESVNPEQICSYRNCRNYADFYCPFCHQKSGGARFCVTCDRKVHTSLNYNHSRIPFIQYQQEEKERQQKINEEKTRNLHSNSSREPVTVDVADQDQFFSILPTSQQLDRQLDKQDGETAEDYNGSEEYSNTPIYLRRYIESESSGQSLEDDFFSIRGSIHSFEPVDMRGGNFNQTRGRIPKVDRQNSSDSSIMKTLEMESRKILLDSINRSVRLIDEEENLLIGNAETFLDSLGMKETDQVKVVSIFGNTGVGKSHSLNAVFFQGKEVFKTSESQESCTYGVWGAYDCRLECLVIDTEGLLGKTTNEPRRRRLLLKVLGISDVVIYRTNAARLETDMFHFLHDASKAFEDYFAPEFKAMVPHQSIEIPVTSMSPYIIVFQETRHTVPLSNDSQSSVLCYTYGMKEDALRKLHKMASDLNLPLTAFPGIKYVGIQTPNNEETNFKPLEVTLRQSLQNDGHCERISRSGRVVFEVLSKLNEKYSGEIPVEEVVAFSSKYFSCRVKCKACDHRCQLCLNHKDAGHSCKEPCKYRAEIGNRVFLCKRCYDSGSEQLVRWQTCTAQESGIMGMMMFLKRGHIIECPNHGVIYRSFEHWYNNPPPEADATVIRVVHVWPGEILLSADGTPGHVGQRIIDMGKSVTNVVSPSLQVASEWVSDQVAPEYWTPNASAQRCKLCDVQLGDKLTKHHCRRCGECVCDHCSPSQMVLPAWGARPVRVCNRCHERPLSSQETETHGKMPERLTPSGRGLTTCNVGSPEVSGSVDTAKDEQLQNTARVVTETVGQAAGVFSSVFKHSASWVKDWARPSYWKPDSELIKCSSCGVFFGPTIDKNVQLKYGTEVTRHHCRRCGDGFCTSCSETRLPVPSRGWESPVRVCNRCSQLKQPL